MSGIDMDWAEAERLWRGSGGLEDRLAMVERALATLGRRNGSNNDLETPGQDRDPGRKK